jgi:hypothetical protein
MRRREIPSVVGSAVATWPGCLRAQQAEQTCRIGALMNSTDEVIDETAASSRIVRWRGCLATGSPRPGAEAPSHSFPQQPIAEGF